jgi:gliding motility-associated-like protein
LKKYISIAFALAFLCNNISAFSQNANLEFIENKGQWDESIKFKGIMNNGSFSLTEKGFKVLQRKPEDLEKMADFFHGASHLTVPNTASKAAIKDKGKNGITIHSHTYNVSFVNAQTPVIVGDKQIDSYNNYFLGKDPSKWKGNCRLFQAITYQNIYPGIDVRYYTNAAKLKYDIIVHAGADLSHLAMQYEGADELQVKNEQLVVKTSVGETRELAPYAFQLVNGVKKEVGCRFKVAGKIVQFAVNNYSKSSELIIDPTLIFSTFTGSTADNWGYTATYGTDGSFYAGGVVFNLEGSFPVSPGAFSTTFNGGVDDEGIGPYDIGIMKFSPNGANRIYATYLGGNGNEQPHSLVADAQGNLVIAGRTNSDNYPTTVTDLTGGKYDIFITKLNAAGAALIGSRKIGGSETDGVNIRTKYPPTPIESIRRNYGDDARSEVILDNSGNIIVASNTQSGDFPASAGAFQKTFAGKQDGVIIKTSPDLSNILFSSYLGGSGNDAAFVLAINPADNNIYIGGNTDGTDMPGDKTNALYPASQGGETEGFVSIINTNGTALLKTSYIGTAGNDMLYGIQFDKFGFPYVMGTTTSDNWPVINAAFSQSKGKQFIAKLKPDLSAYEYSTVFGSGAGTPNISPVAFLVDKCENVYVSGWGGIINTRPNYPNAGTAGLSVTPDAIQSTTDNSDFYFFVLERNASSQLYGSFFGQNGGPNGEHVDGGTSRFDRNGVIYQAVCANCSGGATFPTTPGVWSPSNGSSNCNLAAVKIAFNLAGIFSSIRASIGGAIRDTSGCVPLTVDFTDTLAAGKQYRWNFGDGSPEVETTEPSISHTFVQVGTYQVRLISIDSSKCNIADSAYTNIKVRTDKVNLGFTPQKLLPCESANYQFTNTSYVTATGRAFTNTSFTWYFGDNTPPVVTGNNPITHAFPGVGIYNVRLVLTDTSFCNAPDSIELPLRIAANLTAQFETPGSGCAPYRAVFKNISEGGSQFYWDFGDGVTSTETSPEHIYAVPGTYRIKVRAVDSGTCNITDTTGITIVVSNKPTASYSFTPNPPQENTAVTFLNNSIAATSYIWEFGDGETLPVTSQSPVLHIYNATGDYNSCLIAINNFGCQDTTCQNIVARVLPLLDVPNAFTPNGDGINDKVSVRSYGISKMTWRIYNRWGEKVFETNDRTQGWDGTFKGSLQPKEVYHYVLSVQFIDNTKYEKKGDITLLR